MNTFDISPDNGLSIQLILQALASSPAPTAIYTGEQMRIEFANAGMLALWGKDSSVLGKPLMEAIPELEGQPFLNLLKQVWRSGETYSVCDAPVMLIKNGVAVTEYFDYEYRPLLDADQKVWCILNTALEVTSRRDSLISMQQKEEKEQALNEEMAATLEELTSTNEELNESLRLLAQSRQHVRTIIEQAPVGITMLEGPDHIIEIANTAILKIWGRKESEVVGLPHESARPELAGQPVNQWLQEVYDTGKQKVNSELSVRLYDRGGLREAIVNSIYQPIFSIQGEVTGVLVILEDITRQVLERRKNEKDQHMLAMAIDAGGLATFYYEVANNFFSGNLLLKSWFGLPEDAEMDLSLAIEAMVPEDRERVAAAISDALDINSDGHYAIEYRIKDPVNENPRLVQARGKVIYDSARKPLSLNGTLRDITAQKADEQRKDDFISMVSHELKTPLTSLKAYLQVLQRMAIIKGDKSEQSTLDKSLKQIHNMNGMINGFLNVSRLDSGRMHIEKSEFDLRSLFKELEDELLSSVHTHKIVFQDIEQPLNIYADREKISQVIHNLIGNAVKYSAMGTTITTDCSLIDSERIKISVSDNGMGIAEEDQSRIFERYYRVKGKSTGSIAGFGIGLYLCKEIIEIHNGQIELNSRLNIGSTFSFILPLGESQGALSE